MATEEQDDDWQPALPLTISKLYLAEEMEELIFTAKPGCLSEESIANGIRETDMRLRSRCGGLLETRFGRAGTSNPGWRFHIFIERSRIILAALELETSFLIEQVDHRLVHSIQTSL